MKNQLKPQPLRAADKPLNEKVPIRKPTAVDPLFGLTPFSMMRRFTEDMERIFDNFNTFNLVPRFETDFGFPPPMEFKQDMWRPTIEINEKNGELKVHADLPGMKKEDINVEFLDNALIISGERKNEIEEEREGFFHTEREYGTFYRNIPLPEGTVPEKANAIFHDGVLEITIAMPKRELKGRKLEVTDKPLKAHVKTAG